jgi:hypothetical protein
VDSRQEEGEQWGSRQQDRRVQTVGWRLWDCHFVPFLHLDGDDRTLEGNSLI